MERADSLLFVIIAFKDGDQFRDLEQVADAFGQMEELHIAAGIARAGEEAHHRADATAVDVTDVSQI